MDSKTDYQENMAEIPGPMSKRGQNTAEYLVLLILVTVTSIGIFTIFGKTLRTQVSNVIAAMTGDTDSYIKADQLRANAKEANKRAGKDVSMGGIDGDEINYSKGAN